MSRSINRTKRTEGNNRAKRNIFTWCWATTTTGFPFLALLQFFDYETIVKSLSGKGSKTRTVRNLETNKVVERFWY